MSVVTGGPYVQLAAFCQSTIDDKTGSLSVIRIIDRSRVVGETEQMQPSTVTLTLAIILKSGFMQQKSKVRIKPTTPSGIELPAIESNVLFEGQERGIRIVLPMTMLLPEEGLYWFDVTVDEQLMTRIPLRLMYQQVATETTHGPGQ